MELDINGLINGLTGDETMAGEWALYRDIALQKFVDKSRNGTEHEQVVMMYLLTQTKRAFYTGALQYLTLISEASKNLSGDEFTTRMDGLRDEIINWLMNHIEASRKDPQFMEA